MTFVNLHVHTDYSVLDGAATSKSYARQCKQLNMPSLAITDHGNVMGWVNHYNQCKEYNIKPIFGMEAYMLNDINAFKQINQDISDNEIKFKESKGSEKKVLKEKLSQLKEQRKQITQNNHLVLLAKNKIGYYNIIKISSESYLNYFFKKPLTPFELLQKYKEGIIVLSACIIGYLPQCILNNNLDEAKQFIEQYKNEFGDDFYIELEPNDMNEQFIVNEELVRLAKLYNVKTVITNDCHYVEEDDYDMHNKLLLLQTKSTVQDIDEGKNVFQFSTQGFYLKDRKDVINEMKKNHYNIKKEDVEIACDNTVEISNKIDDIEIVKENIFPKFDCDNSAELLKQKLQEGWNKLIVDKIKSGQLNGEQYRKRLQYEFEIINKFNFCDYFLIVQDIIQQHYKDGYICGPGRGSVGGSLLAFLLEITTIDPIKYDLVFERFLNPNRIKIPDIDIDFENRDKVHEYIQKKYGKTRTAAIVALQRLKTRNLIRDLSRVYNIPLFDADRVAKQYFSNETIDDGYERSNWIKDFFDQFPHIRKLSNKLYDQVRNISRHASGIVITSGDMYNHIPMCVVDNNVLTQWEMSSLDQIGALKIDVLGLSNLTVIHETIDLIKGRHKCDIDINNINLEDIQLLDEFASGNTLGIFQFESKGMTNLLKAIRPSTFNDIIAANALYRPAALLSGFAFEYGKRKRSGMYTCYHKDFEYILQPTYGLIVYQEQFMQLVSDITDVTLGQADLTRRSLSTVAVTPEEKAKKDEEINTLYNFFINKGIQKGYSEQTLTDLWKSLQGVAEYSFNKSHSAAYAKIAMQTMYLKHYYPLEYFTILLSNLRNAEDKENDNLIEKAVRDAKKHNIEFLPIDTRYSKTNFNIENNKIRYSLSLIKGISETSAEIIVDNQDKFNTLEEFYNNVVNNNARIINKRVVDALILSGACDDMIINEEHKKYNNRADKLNYYYFCKGDIRKDVFNSYYSSKNIEDVKQLNIKKIDKQLEVLQQDYNRNQLFNFEIQYCGFSINYSPFDLNDRRSKIDELRKNKYCGEIVSLNDFEYKEDEFHSIIGFISSIIKPKNKKYHYAKVTDDQGESCTCRVFKNIDVDNINLDHIYVIRLKYSETYHSFSIDEMRHDIDVLQFTNSSV